MSSRSAVARSREGQASAAPTLSLVRVFAAIAAAIAVALLVAMVTWGGLNKLRQPRLALAVAPTNGFAYAQAVLMGIASKVGDTPGQLAKVPISPAQRRSALESYGREPFSSQGLAILALGAEADGQTARARQLMTAATQISRRDSLVNGWTVLDASRRNDLDTAIVALNRSMTTSPASTSVYVPAMVRSLEQGASVDVLARILGRRPDWEVAFWRTAVLSPQTIANAGKLRARLVRTSPDDKEIDRAMLSALAARHEFAIAAALYQARSGARTPTGSTIVRNADFAAIPLWPPFDWDVLATGEYSGAVTRDGQGLTVEALPGSGGLVARQLVTIPPGPMQLRAVLTHPFERDGNSLAIRLSCAIPDARVFEADLTATTFTRDFSPGACRYHWLDVVVRAGTSENREPLALRRVEIVPHASR
jgi:hypothetical protein